MLVLNRKKNQTLIIGNAVVTITDLAGNRVGIGIEAPQEVRVLRGELARPEQWPIGHPNRQEANDAA